MNDAVGQIRWTLRGIQPMVRTYRLAIAKYVLDTADETRRDAKMRFALQLQAIFHLDPDQVPWNERRLVSLPVYEYPECSDPGVRMHYDPHLQLKISLALLLDQLLQPLNLGPDMLGMSNPYEGATDHPGLVLYQHALALECLTNQVPLP